MKKALVLMMAAAMCLSSVAQSTTEIENVMNRYGIITKSEVIGEGSLSGFMGEVYFQYIIATDVKSGKKTEGLLVRTYGSNSTLSALSGQVPNQSELYIDCAEIPLIIDWLEVFKTSMYETKPEIYTRFFLKTKSGCRFSMIMNPSISSKWFFSIETSNDKNSDFGYFLKKDTIDKLIGMFGNKMKEFPKQ